MKHYDIKYKCVAVLENTFNFFRWGFGVIVIYTIYTSIGHYNRFKEQDIFTIRESYMVLTGGAGSLKSSPVIFEGYVIGSNKIKKIVVGVKSKGFKGYNYKYYSGVQDVTVGDTLAVWYEVNEGYVLPRFQKNKKELLSYKFEKTKESICISIVIFLLLSFGYFFLKIIRRKIQKIYNISDEEHKYYLKNRNNNE